MALLAAGVEEGLCNVLELRPRITEPTSTLDGEVMRLAESIGDGPSSALARRRVLDDLYLPAEAAERVGLYAHAHTCTGGFHPLGLSR